LIQKKVWALNLAIHLINLNNSFFVLKLAIVSEGVKNEVQMVFLRDIGCHYQQGYYFFEPLPADSLNLVDVVK